LSKIVECLGIISAILVIISLNVFVPYVTGTEAPMAVISGRSMVPLFLEGDIVLLYKPPPQNIRVGDVVVYKRCGGGYIIHRVIEVIKLGDKYYYRTKGDYNPYDDSRLGQFYEYSPTSICSDVRTPGVPYERIVGVAVEINGAVLKIPYLGYISLMFMGFTGHK